MIPRLIVLAEQWVHADEWLQDHPSILRSRVWIVTDVDKAHGIDRAVPFVHAGPPSEALDEMVEELLARGHEWVDLDA